MDNQLALNRPAHAGRSCMVDKNNQKKLNIFTLASFLNDFGSDMIYPIWPLFVTSFAGVNMEVLGLIDGLGDAIVSVSQAISGYWSDRIGKRKIFIWLGYLFGASSRVGYAFAAVWQWLVPFRVLDRAGKMRGAPRDAIIADFSNAGDRGRNFGFLRAFDNLGAVCGIIFTIMFVKTLGYRNLFIIAAIPSVISALAIFFAIRAPARSDKKIYKGLQFKNIDLNFRLFIFLSSIFALGSFSYSFLLIFASRFGFPSYEVPLLYLIFTFAASVMSLPFGRLSDKLKSRKAVVALAYALWLAVCAGFIFAQTWWVVVLIFVVYGFHRAAIDTIQSAFVSELSPVEFRASILGAFQLVIGLCALPASVAAGFIWDKWGMAAPFYLSAALTVCALTLLIFVKEGKMNRGIVESPNR